MVRLDLFIEIPCSDKELAEKIREAPIPRLDQRGWSKEEYSDAEDHYKIRWHESFYVESPEAFELTSYNMLSHKDRSEFRKAILDKDVQGRLDAHLKAIWTLVGKQVDVGIWWTVEPDDRDADIAEEAEQDAYNRVMLSPLEQLATAGQ